jgi:hypothetical protein
MPASKHPRAAPAPAESDSDATFTGSDSDGSHDDADMMAKMRDFAERQAKAAGAAKAARAAAGALIVTDVLDEILTAANKAAPKGWAVMNLFSNFEEEEVEATAPDTKAFRDAWAEKLMLFAAPTKTFELMQRVKEAADFEDDEFGGTHTGNLTVNHFQASLTNLSRAVKAATPATAQECFAKAFGSVATMAKDCDYFLMDNECEDKAVARVMLVANALTVRLLNQFGDAELGLQPSSRDAVRRYLATLNGEFYDMVNGRCDGLDKKLWQWEVAHAAGAGAAAALPASPQDKAKKATKADDGKAGKKKAKK